MAPVDGWGMHGYKALAQRQDYLVNCECRCWLAVMTVLVWVLSMKDGIIWVHLEVLLRLSASEVEGKNDVSQLIWRLVEGRNPAARYFVCFRSMHETYCFREFLDLSSPRFPHACSKQSRCWEWHIDGVRGPTWQTARLDPAGGGARGGWGGRGKKSWGSVLFNVSRTTTSLSPNGVCNVFPLPWGGESVQAATIRSGASRALIHDDRSSTTSAGGQKPPPLGASLSFCLPDLLYGHRPLRSLPPPPWGRCSGGSLDT